MLSLVQHVIDEVIAQEFYDWYYQNEPDHMKPVWPEGGGDARVSSPDRDDHNPSLYVNPVTGAWFDHGAVEGDEAGAGGNHILSFYAKFEGCTVRQAAEQLFSEFIRPTIPMSQVRKWHRTLLGQKQALRYLAGRMLNAETISKHLIGWDGTRITFPVMNEYGMCVNVRKYDPRENRGKIPKMINHVDRDEPRRFGTPAMVYPYSEISKAHEIGQIFIVEGEWDALFLNQLGIPTITSTHGVKTWPKGYSDLLRNLEVVVCFDNDAAGISATTKLIKRELSKVARVVKRLKVPKKFGKDVSDWGKNSKSMKKKSGWLNKVKGLIPVLENNEDFIKNDTPELTPLDKARSHTQIGKNMRILAIVAGKSTDPLTVPMKYRITCESPGKDEKCPLHKSGKEFVEGKIDPMSELMFDLLHKNKTQVKIVILKLHGFDPKSEAKPSITVLQYAAFEELRIQPSFGSGAKENVTAQAFTYGIGIRANQAYEFSGTAFPSEVHNITKLIFNESSPAQTEVETFKMSPEMLNNLNRFKAKSSRKSHVIRKLHSMAEWQSRNVTKIKQRSDLHIACDLVYHSVNCFDFNGEFVHKGMLDVIIMGDTRCGKGYVAEGLQKYYGVGEVASGENCSIAGLIGGAQQMGKQWFITWGIVPMNDGRLVVIDEASSIADSGGFSRLSRIRSEGVAEITKIVREVAPAKSRLLWLANPLTGRPLMSYQSGAHAIKELVGANEDISRFDYALTVATGEVDTAIINEIHVEEKFADAEKFTKKSCQNLVMWAWSRTKEQVKFTKEAVGQVIESSMVMGSKYSPTIPLVQAENIRVKLARISASVAARVFSSDVTGEILIVDKGHVQAACMLIDEFYSKASMGYDKYSKKDKIDKSMKSGDVVSRIFKEIRGEGGNPLLQFLLGEVTFNSDSVDDYIPAEEDPKEIIRKLISAKCITRSGTNKWYRQSVQFRKWLSDNREEIENG